MRFPTSVHIFNLRKKSSKSFMFSPRQQIILSIFQQSRVISFESLHSRCFIKFWLFSTKYDNFCFKAKKLNGNSQERVFKMINMNTRTWDFNFKTKAKSQNIIFWFSVNEDSELSWKSLRKWSRILEVFKRHFWISCQKELPKL